MTKKHTKPKDNSEFLCTVRSSVQNTEVLFSRLCAKYTSLASTTHNEIRIKNKLHMTELRMCKTISK